MEHAKKMMLVDTNFDIGNIKRRHTLLDQNISEVLDRQDIDDREKIKLYQQTLNKYLVNRKLIENELNRPLKVEVAANKTESVAEPDKVKIKRVSEPGIKRISSLPEIKTKLHWETFDSKPLGKRTRKRKRLEDFEY